MRIYVNKMENGITFKIRTMKLLGNTKNNINKDENGENKPHLEIAEVVLVHCNIVSNNYQKVQETCIHLFLINHLVN